MSTGTNKGDKRRNRTTAHGETLSRKVRALRIGAAAVVLVGIAVLALGAIFFANSPNKPSSAGAPGSSGARAGEYAYEVGSPGPGEEAPPIELSSTEGGTFDLASRRGETVLLYFQEGLTCQACWDQLKDIEARWGKFQDLGIDEMVTITNDPLDALEQKVESEGISTPALSDPNLAVSKTYDANKYGMMGESRNGHTFIIVGPEGKIEWRADYGGAPDYTMYVPVPNLLADMRKGLEEGSG